MQAFNASGNSKTARRLAGIPKVRIPKARIPKACLKTRIPKGLYQEGPYQAWHRQVQLLSQKSRRPKRHF